MTGRIVSLLVVLAVCGVGMRVEAALDQQNVVPTHVNQINGLALEASFSPAQTFTVGISGRLAEVDVGVFASPGHGSGITASINQLSGGLPDFSPAGVLASRFIPDAQIPLLTGSAIYSPYFSVAVDFSASNLMVHGGDMLAIVLRSNDPSPGPYNWWSSDAGTDPYHRGNAYTLVMPGNHISGQATDAHFRTFVGVPEPGSLALAVFGALIFAVGARRIGCNWEH